MSGNTRREFLQQGLGAILSMYIPPEVLNGADAALRGTGLDAAADFFHRLSGSGIINICQTMTYLGEQKSYGDKRTNFERNVKRQENLESMDNMHKSLLKGFARQIRDFRAANAANIQNDQWKKQLKDKLTGIESESADYLPQIGRIIANQVSWDGDAVCFARLRPMRELTGKFFDIKPVLTGQTLNPSPELISARSVYQLITGPESHIDSFVATLEGINNAVAKSVIQQVSADIAYDIERVSKEIRSGNYDLNNYYFASMYTVSAVPGRAGVYVFEPKAKVNEHLSPSVENALNAMKERFDSQFKGQAYSTLRNCRLQVEVSPTSSGDEAREYFETVLGNYISNTVKHDFALSRGTLIIQQMESLRDNRISSFSERIKLENCQPAEYIR